jgi:hypothetical protein
MYSKSFLAIVLFTSIQVAVAGLLLDSEKELAVYAGNGTVANAEIITRCEAPPEYNERLQQVRLGSAAQGEGSRMIATESVELTLIRQGDNYDVLIGRDSLGNGVAWINAGGEDPVHLILDNNTGFAGLEHFLFDLNLDGSGELLWSSASESALTTCVAGI